MKEWHVHFLQHQQNMLNDHKIKLNPLNDEDIETICNMLNNISGAGLPSSFVEYYLMKEVNEVFGTREKAISDVTKWMIEKMIQYIESVTHIPPFSEAMYAK